MWTLWGVLESVKLLVFMCHFKDFAMEMRYLSLLDHN